MSDLASKKCIPCEKKGILPMAESDAQTLLANVPGWNLEEGKKITRSFLFADFLAAMSFVNKVATVAESEGHHPDIAISYNKVTLTLYTHSIDGLHENDFILAAKINQL